MVVEIIIVMLFMSVSESLLDTEGVCACVCAQLHAHSTNRYGNGCT